MCKRCCSSVQPGPFSPEPAFKGYSTRPSPVHPFCHLEFGVLKKWDYIGREITFHESLSLIKGQHRSKTKKNRSALKRLKILRFHHFPPFILLSLFLHTYGKWILYHISHMLPKTIWLWYKTKPSQTNK